MFYDLIDLIYSTITTTQGCINLSQLEDFRILPAGILACYLQDHYSYNDNFFEFGEYRIMQIPKYWSYISESIPLSNVIWHSLAMLILRNKNQKQRNLNTDHEFRSISLIRLTMGTIWHTSYQVDGTKRHKLLRWTLNRVCLIFTRTKISL